MNEDRINYKPHSVPKAVAEKLTPEELLARQVNLQKHGVYLGCPDEHYHAYHGSVSSSELRTLNDDAPVRVLWNRQFRKEDSESLKVGKLVHSSVLEGKVGLVASAPVIDLENKDELTELMDVDWATGQIVVVKGARRTKDARELHGKLTDAGVTILKEESQRMVLDMLKAQEQDEWATRFFADGEPEVTLRWKCRDTGIQCKARLDYLPNSTRLFPDLKTIDKVSDGGIIRALTNFRYYQQMQFYMEGVKELGICDNPKPVLLFQEKDEPFACRVLEFTEDQMELGKFLNEEAKRKYATALNEGFTGYPPTALELPDWHYRKFGFGAFG